ncbi:rhomboid family intramembrane serine protease [Frigidibacter sp. MR17.24]|uniref:rhomboid family intramembrane serine protease n=1 Tax=Frigidibacter sp. MR17.24 TaxID=3127345 RepID=UPI003012FE93
MNEPRGESPLNPIPPVVWALFLPVAAMEIVLSAGGSGLVGGAGAIGWRLDALQRFSFSPQLFRWMLENGHWPPGQLVRILTYPFVHGSMTHALFVAVFLLALGKMVAEVFSALAVVTVFVVAAIAGALVYTVIPGDLPPLYGGYPPVYGLIGAFTFILWQRLGAVQANQYRAFSLIGFLLGIQLVFGLIFGGTWQTVSEIAGFAAGFLVSFVVAPGGWRAVLRRLRAR